MKGNHSLMKGNHSSAKYTDEEICGIGASTIIIALLVSLAMWQVIIYVGIRIWRMFQ